MCNITLYIKVNVLWMLFLQKKKLKTIIVGVEHCLNAMKSERMGCIASGSDV